MSHVSVAQLHMYKTTTKYNELQVDELDKLDVYLTFITAL